MIYNDEILENKAFNFFKQLMYNIALAVCIMLIGVLILVYGFKFRLYEVLSDSQAPYFTKGDMVVVKAQKEYKVGDIIKFDTSKNKTMPTTHRLIAILEEGGKTYYICHGDNVQDLDGGYAGVPCWEDDAAYIQDMIDNNKTLSDILSIPYKNNIQVPTLNQIEGKVVAHIDNYGTYFQFLKTHYLLFIALVAGIWCISSTIQNEIDIKKCRRLM